MSLFVHVYEIRNNTKKLIGVLSGTEIVKMCQN